MRTIYASILLLFILTACSAQKNTTQYSFHDNPVIAHRGAWKNTGHPQNSIASLKAAIDMKCHGSEIDVQLTAEDSLIVFHDLKCQKMVIDSTGYEELIKVRLANGEKIPTLRECLAEAKKQKGTKLIIDIKTPYHTPRAVENAKAVLKLVQEMQAEPLVEFLVGDLNALDYLISASTIPVAYLGRWKNELPEMYPEVIMKHHVKFLDYQDVHYRKHPDWITTFKENRIHLNAWTVNKEEDMLWFLEKDFNYITTDEPELLLNLVKKYISEN